MGWWCNGCQCSHDGTVCPAGSDGTLYYPMEQSIKLVAAVPPPDITRQLVRAAVKAFAELNRIRARDGVPYTRDGYKSCVCEEYFSSVVDELDSAVRAATGKSAHCHPELYSKE